MKENEIILLFSCYINITQKCLPHPPWVVPQTSQSWCLVLISAGLVRYLDLWIVLQTPSPCLVLISPVENLRGGTGAKQIRWTRTGETSRLVVVLQTTQFWCLVLISAAQLEPHTRSFRVVTSHLPPCQINKY